MGNFFLGGEAIMEHFGTYSQKHKTDQVTPVPLHEALMKVQTINICSCQFAYELTVVTTCVR